MQVTIDIPEDVAKGLQAKWSDVERGALECVAIEGYRSGALTTEQVRRMLGYGTRMQVDELLKKAGVYLEYTDEDFAQDIETNRRF
jgi:predicted HTH domain antitoxin